MKIVLEVDENLEEQEVIIKCPEINEDTMYLQKQISELLSKRLQLQVSKGDADFYIELHEIIFLETTNNLVAVHTADQIYESKERLYELENILPGSFMRVSKSTIINTDKVRAIHKNITGASEVEFVRSPKKTYVSRNYIKILLQRLDEKRLKK